jgi:hypothetical protein
VVAQAADLDQSHTEQADPGSDKPAHPVDRQMPDFLPERQNGCTAFADG